MTKLNTKAVINQSFLATYYFYWIRIKGTSHNNHIQGAVSCIFFRLLHLYFVGVNEDKTENTKYVIEIK